MVLLGDFNTGPGGWVYQAEVAANYELLTAAMFTNPYIESGAPCTFCGDNPLQDGDTDVVIDHVLTRDLDASAVSQRILDESLMITVDGDDITTALSDHYGVLLALTRDPAE